MEDINVVGNWLKLHNIYIYIYLICDSKDYTKGTAHKIFMSFIMFLNHETNNVIIP